MASSPFISNPEASISSTSSRESNRKKRRKIDTNNNQSDNQQHQFQSDHIRWKTGAEHQIYTSKLVEALCRRNCDSPVTGAFAIRETADRVLAVAAKGRSRWSRAILTKRLRFQMNMNKHKKSKSKSKKVKVTGEKRSKELPAKKKVTAVKSKARILGRLVPGCRKVSFPNLLEETADYIAALEMQVRAMTALAGLLTGSAQSVNRLGPITD